MEHAVMALVLNLVLSWGVHWDGTLMYSIRLGHIIHARKNDVSLHRHWCGDISALCVDEVLVREKLHRTTLLGNSQLKMLFVDCQFPW